MSYLTVGKRNLRTLLEQKVNTNPHKTFMVFEESDEITRLYSYSQFNAMVNKTANALLSLGIGKGDKINLHLTNCPEFLFLWFATAKIGAVMMPTNPLSPPDELRYPVDHSESVITVTQPDLLHNIEAILPLCPNIRNVVLTRTNESKDDVILFNELVDSQSEELADIDLNPLDDAAIMYTSGTTSLPKGVMVTHANFVFLGEVLSKNMRMSPDDRYLVTLPLYHANAMYYMVTSSLMVGASIALMPRFSATRFMKQAIRYECTLTSLFAAPMRMILAQPIDKHERQNSFRLVIFAQNVTGSQMNAWEDRFGDSLMQIYGMTETMGQPLTNPVDYTRDNMTMGLPTLPYECKIVDPQGNEVTEGEAGELLVRGIPGWTIMKVYFKDPDATARTIKDDWLWTGDIVEIDDAGYFRFVDRSKDMIKRSGENIAASEVEDVIKGHPKVADVAVIGVPDEIRDESIKAFVILNAGKSSTADELIDHCRSKLSKFRVPEEIEFCDEFPRTSVGKIQKHILRQIDQDKRK